MRVILKKGSKAVAGPPGVSESSSSTSCSGHSSAQDSAGGLASSSFVPAPDYEYSSTGGAVAAAVAAAGPSLKKRSRSPVVSEGLKVSAASVPPPAESNPSPRSDQKPSSNNVSSGVGARKKQRHSDSHVTFADQPNYLSPTAAAALLAAAVAADLKPSSSNQDAAAAAAAAAASSKHRHHPGGQGSHLELLPSSLAQQPQSSATAAAVAGPAASGSGKPPAAANTSSNTNMGVPSRHRSSWENEEADYVRSVRRDTSPGVVRGANNHPEEEEEGPVSHYEDVRRPRIHPNSSPSYGDDGRRDQSEVTEDPALSSWGGYHSDIRLRSSPMCSAASLSSSSRGRSTSPVTAGTGTAAKKRPSSSPSPTIEPAFQEALKKGGLEMVEQDGDGNCLFRAVSLQVYGDPNNHIEVRKRCMDFMAKDEAHFAQFIPDEPFREYIRRKRISGVHGNNPEIQAISELFNRPVELYVPENGAKPINIFQADYKTSDDPIRLSYHDGNHYNAVVDPFKPTAGLGLGLPGLKPGLADKMQMDKAKEESDRAEIERAKKESMLSQDRMYEKKAFALSDLDAADFDLEQAVLQSSLQSYMNEQGRKQSHRPHSHHHHHPHHRERGRRQGSTPSPTGYSHSSSSARHAHGYGYGGGAASAAAAASRDDDIYSSTSAASSSASSAVARSSAFAGAAGAATSSVYQSSPPHSGTSGSTGADLGNGGEYPACVEELVMNGFELPKVLRAYELVGDNFDSLLSFLMSNTG